VPRHGFILRVYRHGSQPASNLFSNFRPKRPPYLIHITTSKFSTTRRTDFPAKRFASSVVRAPQENMLLPTRMVNIVRVALDEDRDRFLQVLSIGCVQSTIRRSLCLSLSLDINFFQHIQVSHTGNSPKSPNCSAVSPGLSTKYQLYSRY
jgi:hypothetical protein